MRMMRLTRIGAAAVAAGFVAWGAYAAVAWSRYGRVHPERHPPDELLDRFLPDPEVDEYHRMRVHAPADVTFETAKQMDLMGAAPIRAIFFLRALPKVLQGEPFRPEGSRSILDETLSQGWGVLGEVPGREVVVGSYTQPWHEEVTFHPLPPENFAGFEEPGFVKIVWTLGAEPLGPKDSIFVTRTRVATTDAFARKRFRLYWAPMSAGIILIRYFALPRVKRAAERRARLVAHR